MNIHFQEATENDQLEEHDPRHDLAQQLDDLIATAPGPLTLSIEGAWGSGKSDFLKRWMRSEPDRETSYAYFDAFLNDHATDPLIGLTRAVVSAVEDDIDKPVVLKRIKNAAVKAAPGMLRIGLAAATAGVSEVVGKQLGEIAKAATDAASGEFGGIFDADNSREAAMQQFRGALEELTVSEDAANRKLVIIVDELDRCRPDYALQVLEVVKHFFDVAGVFFLLGYERDTMEAAIKARYGDVNAGVYLDKFIHMSLGLPKRQWANVSLGYTQNIMARYGLPDGFGSVSAEIWRHSTLYDLLTYRTIQRACTTLKLLDRSVGYERPFHATAAMLWAFAKHLFPHESRQMFRGNKSADWFVPALRIDNHPSNGDGSVAWACLMTHRLFGAEHRPFDDEMLGSDQSQHRKFQYDAKSFFAPLAPTLKA